MLINSSDKNFLNNAKICVFGLREWVTAYMRSVHTHKVNVNCVYYV